MQVLRRIRGVEDVSVEFGDIVVADGVIALCYVTPRRLFSTSCSLVIADFKVCISGTVHGEQCDGGTDSRCGIPIGRAHSDLGLPKTWHILSDRLKYAVKGWGEWNRQRKEGIYLGNQPYITSKQTPFMHHGAVIQVYYPSAVRNGRVCSSAKKTKQLNPG